MNDTEFTMFVFLWIFGGIILFQWWRIHRYRNKIEQLAFDHAKAGSEPVQTIAQASDPQRDEELERIKKRLQVLERIATDDNSRLENEFEALRRA